MVTLQSRLLRALMIGIGDDVAAIAIAALTSAGFDPVSNRVASCDSLIAALDAEPWDLVLSDCLVDRWPGMDALLLVRERDAAVPFIFVCDAIGADFAAELMRAGANDIVLENALSRLAPAIERELSGAGPRALRSIVAPERGNQAAVPDENQDSASGALFGEDHDQVFRAVVENTPDLVARFSRDLRRRYVNPAIERLTGLPASELIGKTMRELNFDSRFSDLIEQQMMEVFATGTEKTLEVFLPAPDGERVYHSRMVPEIRPGQEVEHVLVLSRDITAIRRDGERLRALSREVELLLASTYEGICAGDLAGTCTLVNASAASMLGYTSAEMLGRSMHELLHRAAPGREDCARGQCGLLRVMSERRPAHLHDVLWRRDETRFPVEIFISPILGDDGDVRGTVASFIDITSRQQLQEELERANRMAGLGRVASAMSHEFNNVLMGIQPFAEVLLRISREPKVTDAANRIIQSVKRGRGITEDLRAFTRPAPPVLEIIDVHSLLAVSTSELQRLLPATIRLDISAVEMPMTIEADRGQIAQVLSSLVLNAREAIGANEGSIRVRVDVSAEPAEMNGGSFIHFSVSDDGPGIPAQNLARIFEPFYTTKKGGKGLGLAIAQQIATLHGGRLYAESEEGAGTTAHLFLPASKNEAPQKIAGAGTPAQRHWPQDLLLVEDDEAVAAGVVMLLHGEQIDVRLAADVAGALKILENYRPQVLVIDINLPDGNGFDLYEKITTLFGPLPVVFASGHADARRLESIHTPAAVRMLAKPYEIDALLDLLNSLAPAGP